MAALASTLQATLTTNTLNFSSTMRIIKYSTSDSIVGNLVPTSFKSISKFNSKISCNSIRAEMNIPTSPVYATGDPSIFNSSTGFNPFPKSPLIPMQLQIVLNSLLLF